MASAVLPRMRVVVDGKFFRIGGQKFYIKGIAYGPLAPDAQGSTFASREQSGSDFRQIRDLGANLLRLYHVPPRWFLDLAEESGLKVLVDVPWNKHLCFDSRRRQAEARETVRRAAEACAGHPALFAYSVANEVPADIVRWAGADAVAGFIDTLVGEARRADPGCLCTFTNFPPTEFLRPSAPDFACFNVYLHQRQPFRNYLSRLQIIADSKPLVLGEFGMDSLREGEARKSETLAWQIEEAFRGGLAGTIVFTYTDDWFRGGQRVDDWAMGLVTGDRRAKESFASVQGAFRAAPHFPLQRSPKVSVVVAAFNAEGTLQACLESLDRLKYPQFEVILVDDGSTDGTPQIAKRRAAAGIPEPQFISLRHERNLGLSTARNTGIAAAAGEIVAFTDADCRVDEDWLYYLAGDLLNSAAAGLGGPNLPPRDDSFFASAVMASPGGPAHVLLTDRIAEHIPGCNMAFYRNVLQEMGGFDPAFRTAGDDVDFCWRLQQAGYQIGFSPAAFVWHHRRSTLRAYLKQQRGYGEAEALLVKKHPENFNAFGDSVWHGRIYGPSSPGLRLRGPMIYRGLFGSAGFQKLYATQPVTILMLCTGLGYYVFVALPLWVLSAIFHPLIFVAAGSLLLPLGVCAAAAAQAELPRHGARFWSRPLVALLFILQPLVRGWARYHGRLTLRPPLPLGSHQSLDSLALRTSSQRLDEVQYWAEHPVDRLALVASISERLSEGGWITNSDIGWSDYDLEICGSRWSRLQLTTAAEDHPQGRQLIRCRLRTALSPEARIALGSTLGLALLLIGLVDSWRPWSWLLLLALPSMAWGFFRDQRNLRSLIAALLDQLAREKELVKVPAAARA